MAKSSDQRLELEALLTSNVVDLTALKTTLSEASEFEPEVEVAVPTKQAKQAGPSQPKEKKSGSKKRKRQRPPTVYELVDKAVYLPVTYDLANCITIDQEGPGRPRLHPVFMNFLYLAAVPDARSYWKTDGAFDNDFMWRRTRRLISNAWNSDPAYDIGATPIAYSHAARFFDRHVVGKPDVIAALYDCYVRFSVDLAQRMAIMNPTAGSYTNPRPDRFFIGDGTVVAPLYKALPGDTWVDPETGEIRVIRHDPTAGWYRTGTKEVVRGTLWANCQIRSEHENERVNLGFARVPRGRGDASVFMDLVENIRGDFPMSLGHIYDMAMDGESINRGYRMGLVPMTKVALDKKGLPSSSFVGNVTVVDKAGRAREIPLWTLNGAIGIEVVTASAEHHVRLDLEQVKFSKNSDGAQRAYGRFRFPDHALIAEPLRGAKTMVRLDQCDDDLTRNIKGRPYNRAVYLRPFPEGSEGFNDVYGAREDAESFNNLLKQSLWNKRSHSLNTDRQFLDMLAFNLNRNIRAAMAHEARTGVTLFPEMEHGRPSLAEVTASLSRALAI